MADEQEQRFRRRFFERLEQRVGAIGFQIVHRIDDDHAPLAERQREVQAADHLPHLFDGDVAREFLGLVLRLTREAENLGMVSSVNKACCRTVARIVEIYRLTVTAAVMGHEKSRDAFGEDTLSHPLRSGEEPCMVQATALPPFEKSLFSVVVADHHSHSASSARILAVTSDAAASASTIRHRTGSPLAISTKRAASRA